MCPEPGCNQQVPAELVMQLLADDEGALQVSPTVGSGRITMVERLIQTACLLAESMHTQYSHTHHVPHGSDIHITATS